MIIERTSHETIIATTDCKYIAAIEMLFGSEEADALRYARFGDVGFNDALNLYPDEFDAFRRLLDEVESYLKKPNFVELHQIEPDSTPHGSE